MLQFILGLFGAKPFRAEDFGELCEVEGQIYNVKQESVLTFGYLLSQDFTDKDLSIVPLSDLTDDDVVHVDFSKDHEEEALTLMDGESIVLQGYLGRRYDLNVLMQAEIVERE